MDTRRGRRGPERHYLRLACSNCAQELFVLRLNSFLSKMATKKTVVRRRGPYNPSGSSLGENSATQDEDIVFDPILDHRLEAQTFDDTGSGPECDIFNGHDGCEMMTVMPSAERLNKIKDTKSGANSDIYKSDNNGSIVDVGPGAQELFRSVSIHSDTPAPPPCRSH